PVVHTSLRNSRGIAGAPGSVPGAISPPSCWLRTPHGSTANNTTHQIRKKIAIAVVTGMSAFFQFDQGAGEVLRMKEQHRLAVGTDPRLAIAKNARTGGFEARACRADIV